MPRKIAPPPPPPPAPASADENLALWDSVQTTDPKYTKKFTRSGGFSGTAINATYLAKRATECFGPIGIGWGVTIESEEYAKGAPIVDDKHGLVGHEVIHVLRIVLWYELDGVKGEVRHYGQTYFVGKNKHGVYTDEEAPKKSLTDATGKALSLLGFASDVHLGLFDDNKYVNDVKASIAEAEKPKGPTLDEIVAKVTDATTMAALKASVAMASTLNAEDSAALRIIYVAKQAAIKGDGG